MNGRQGLTNIYLISLGCPRNLLDSEVLLGELQSKNFNIVDKPEEADIAVVNTCGFIEDAKQESINVILQLASLKKEGKIEKLIIAGCLSQRYPKELLDEIKEIDGVFGTSDFMKIPEMLKGNISKEPLSEITKNPDFLYDHKNERKLLTSPKSVYVKIQEGCSNRCSYCVIPDLKGPRRSRSIDSILDEIKTLKAKYNPEELLLIGQDTTSFGIDTEGESKLPQLLKKVSNLHKNGWVRLLYTHPVHFTEQLIDVIAENQNICKYIDLPIQHINDDILKRMNRRVTREQITELIVAIRQKIPEVTLRTSIIVGFPGETDEQFEELFEFLKEISFDRLGTFIYSREEGTPAAEFENQISEDIKKERLDRIMRLQQEISVEKNLKFLDKTLKVLIDEKDPSDPEQYLGRSEMDAPEVDGLIYVKGENLTVGDFVNVKITGTMEYDLIGEMV